MKNKVTTIIIILATILLSGAAIYTAVRLYQLRAKPVAPNVPESKPAAHGLQTATPKPTATASPNPSICRLKFNIDNPLCNSVCTTSAQCPSGLSCVTGFCRNVSCSTATNCLCPTPSPSPTPKPTATPTVAPTPTPSPSPSPTPVPQCNNSCTSSSQCPSGLSCYIASGTTGFCRNTSCVNKTDCTCPTPSPSTTPVPTSGPTSTPAPTNTPTNPPTTIAYVPTATPVPQPTLPESGTDWPTVMGIMFGVFVIVGSVLLAF